MLKAQKGAQLIMKPVATALVLIAAAAVVLWSGNTLNSWVLGGLIGGLAALLISIPISLTVFSHLSKRHGTFLNETAVQEVSLAQTDEYPADYYYDDEPDYDKYEVEGSLYAVDGEYASEREFYSQHPVYDDRHPASYQRAPMRMNSKNSKRLLPPGRPSNGGSSKSRKLSESTTTRSNHTQSERRSVRNTSPGSTLSLHRSQALRRARQEAVRRRDEKMTHREDIAQEVHSPSVDQYLEDQRDYYPPVARRASRHLSTRRSRHGREEDTLTDKLYQEREYREEDDAEMPYQDPYTDYLEGLYPRTEPINQALQSGYVKRHYPRQRKFQFDPEVSMDNLQRPVVRRAPYLYDDDPLRQELSPYFDHPVARRTSRLEELDEE